MSASEKHPRLILRNFLPVNLCKELEFIHKSCCTVGYRPNVFSTTLSHLIATNSPHLIMPIVPIRERIKETVEEHFGCEYELFVEFTGLISWCKGSSIGWHSDDNRDYLKQRDFGAVCYLNTYEVDFKGGLFHFQDGEPSTIAPMAGDVIVYTADNKNIHSVGEITEGERVTLTLWFSRDASHDEDAKLLQSLSNCTFNSPEYNNLLSFPMQAPNNMYWFPPDEASRFESGFDLRSARLHVLGFDISSSDEGSSGDFLKLLEETLHLAWGNQLLAMKFMNISHALQVVQFYYWNASKCKTAEVNLSPIDVMILSDSERRKIDRLKGVLLKDIRLAGTIFGHTICRKNCAESFDWISFSAVIYEWEDYTRTLQKEMLTSLPYWRKHQSVFSVISLDNEPVE